MAVTVRIPTVLRKHTDGEKAVTGEGATIKELIGDLSTRHPGLTEAITSEDGQLAKFVNVYLNDEDVRFLEGADTGLKDGDELSILPAVAGGAGAVGVAGGAGAVGVAGGAGAVGVAGGAGAR